uniref:Late embryogenesis abundant protein LEA-2 subgroup domain-containing protein n=1 Tax=Kalanchoe fedtschenkoi TaxID=63787 RepID=A0A7N1A6V4_KALFE
MNPSSPFLNLTHASMTPITAPPLRTLSSPPPAPPTAREFWHTANFQRLMFLLVVFIIFISIYNPLNWLLTHVDIPEVRVYSVALNHFTATSDHLSAQLDVTFAVRNPNARATIRYNKVEASVFSGWGDDVLSLAKLPSFAQDTKSTTQVKAKMWIRVSAWEMGNSNGIFSGIMSERISGVVRLNMDLYGDAIFSSKL